MVTWFLSSPQCQTPKYCVCHVPQSPRLSSPVVKNLVLSWVQDDCQQRRVPSCGLRQHNPITQTKKYNQPILALDHMSKGKGTTWLAHLIKWATWSNSAFTAETFSYQLGATFRSTSIWKQYANKKDEHFTARWRRKPASAVFFC